MGCVYFILLYVWKSYFYVQKKTTDRLIEHLWYVQVSGKVLQDQPFFSHTMISTFFQQTHVLPLARLQGYHVCLPTNYNFFCSCRTSLQMRESNCEIDIVSDRPTCKSNSEQFLLFKSDILTDMTEIWMQAKIVGKFEVMLGKFCRLFQYYVFWIK